VWHGDGNGELWLRDWILAPVGFDLLL
jgi:hypothetical protein